MTEQEQIVTDVQEQQAPIIEAVETETPITETEPTFDDWAVEKEEVQEIAKSICPFASNPSGNSHLPFLCTMFDVSQLSYTALALLIMVSFTLCGITISGLLS